MCWHYSKDIFLPGAMASKAYTLFDYMMEELRFLMILSISAEWNNECINEWDKGFADLFQCWFCLISS